MKYAGSDGSLLIACALKKEALALEKRLRIKGSFLATGFGGERTARRLHKRFESESPAFFIFTGTAGQLDPSIRIGQVLLPREWCLENGSCFRSGPELIVKLTRAGLKTCDRGLTVSAPVVRNRTRKKLHHQFKAQICDMESAYALDVASRHQVPAVAPKVVSDTAESGLLAFYKEFDRNMDRLAAYLDRLLKVLA